MTIQKRFTCSRALTIWLACLVFVPAQAMAQQALSVPSFFNDSMVIQRDKPIVVWGWSPAGARVDVTFHDATASATASQDGDWKIVLPAQSASGIGAELSVQCGEDSISIKDVLVGEVWFASGQSNMAMTLNRTDNAEAELAQAQYPQFRMFLAANTPAMTPQKNIQGQWQVCTPETAKEFSAVAYYFAKRIHQETGVPVGIIKSCIGGKRCECYCSREAMLSNANGKQMIAELDAQQLAFDEEAAAQKFESQLENWKQQTARIREANQDLPEADRKPLPRRPQRQVAPMLNPGNPTVLYNGMIHPFVGFNMRGAIWYQGEANCRANLAPIYREMFSLMIEDWRSRWDDPFPFYFVQLANFRQPTTEPGVENEWATVQNQQRLTLQLPHTGMAVINDIGMSNDIHPKNKQDVGLRLARWALKNEYGKSVVVSGPQYRSMTVKGNRVVIDFDHVANGLKRRDDEPLKRFEIAGADRKWHWATAEIDGQHVVVSSPEVDQPIAVRYAWASNPVGANLVNSEGLPASIFRTDDWPVAFGK